MWLISPAAVRGGTFLQRDGQGSSTSSPLVLQASNLIRSPGLRCKLPLCWKGQGPGCLVVPEALALHPPPPDAHGAGTGRTCVPERGGGRGGGARSLSLRPHLASLWVRVRPRETDVKSRGWERGHLAAAARNSGRRARPSGGPGWEGAAAARGPRGSDGGGRSDGAENGAGRGGVWREVLILIVSV